MNESKHILLTGASSGIGAATAELLRNEGYTVYAVDVCDMTEKEGVIAFTADITDKARLEEICTELDAKGVTLDAIVNVAGIHGMFSLVEGDAERMRRLIDVNLTGTIYVNRIFHRLLAPRGRIVIVTSEVAPLAPMPFNGLYNVSKTALDCYAQALRQELNLLGQSVVTIRPGAIETPLASGSLRSTDALSRETVLYHKQASRFLGITRRFMGTPLRPQKLATLILRALRAKRPRLIYHKHRNAGLVLLSCLPLRAQCFVIRLLLSTSR
ncbi:MAG: SDR family NAD(P)-dependent oxidoreductase [Clostridia bacterium]|nr:SDR family NAD(P)-dependent oxidoreductase [Clostridia bacterium]